MHFIYSHHRLFFTIGTIFLVLYLFSPSFNGFFFQDDWFSLLISNARNTGDFLRFFIPRSDLIYYRPLGMQVPFFLNLKLFGVTPWPLRIATFGIHLCNGWLVYQLFMHFLGKKIYAQVGAFLYLTSVVHMIIFYWSATFAFVLAPLFFFAGFLLFVRNHIFKSLLLFTLGLFANELLITFPLLITLYSFLRHKKTSRRLVIFWFIAVGYVLFRLTTKPPTSGEYTLVSSVGQLARNIRGYFLWSFNWPEEINSQFISFLRINPQFIREFRPVFIISMVNSLVFISVGVRGIWRWARQKKLRSAVWLLFAIVWWFVSLSPVLIFDTHYFAYYLPIPLFGFLLVVLSLLRNVKMSAYGAKFLLLGLCLIWYITALTTMNINQLIHWVPRRAQLSHELVQKIRKEYPVLPSHAVVFIPDSKTIPENKWALGEGNALKVLYNDTTIETQFVDTSIEANASNDTEKILK